MTWVLSSLMPQQIVLYAKTFDPFTAFNLTKIFALSFSVLPSMPMKVFRIIEAFQAYFAFVRSITRWEVRFHMTSEINVALEELRASVMGAGEAIFGCYLPRYA
jgi:hypothetical protein